MEGSAEVDELLEVVHGNIATRVDDNNIDRSEDVRHRIQRTLELVFTKDRYGRGTGKVVDPEYIRIIPA